MEMEDTVMSGRGAPKGVCNPSIQSLMDIYRGLSLCIPGEMRSMESKINEGQYIEIINKGIAG